MENYSIIWDNEAVKEFKKIIIQIKFDSPQNAEIVKNSVISFVNSLSKNPNRCTQLKNSKSLNIRFHIVKKFKIIFEIDNNTVYITNIFSAKKRI